MTNMYTQLIKDIFGKLAYDISYGQEEINVWYENKNIKTYKKDDFLEAVRLNTNVTFMMIFKDDMLYEDYKYTMTLSNGIIHVKSTKDLMMHLSYLLTAKV